MRIVIDMQGAQTQSRHRGIGRYTLSLAKAMVLNRGQHEIILALNGIFSETIGPIRSAFRGILPQDNIRVWYAPGPVSHSDTDNDWRRGSAEFTREAFLASLNPSIVLVSSMFEGYSEDAVTSIGKLGQKAPTAAILYDLIFLIHRGHYLQNSAMRAWYEKKLENFRHADLVLSISESARQEGLDHLGLQSNSIVNISAAADSQFRPFLPSANKQVDLRNRYGLQRSIVMYTGGIDHRKNVEALVRAYALLPLSLRQAHQLAVVCAVQAPDRARLNALAKSHGLAQDELVMTGYVSDEDLLALYNLCTVFVFPSWHEGFGLPVLEAMSCGKAVLGANASSLPEVINREDALFDPFNDCDIKTKLERVLVDDAFRTSLELHGLQQAQKFSWKRSAETALRALENLVASHEEKSRSEARPPHRPRLAYISPLPPDRSGISGYSVEMLPELARHYQIDVILPEGHIDVQWTGAAFPVRTVDWFKANASTFDRVLYHFGNSTFHQHMFALLDLIPGVVVLHDFFLSNILAQMEFSGSSPGIWTESLYSGHGYSAVKLRFGSNNIGKAVVEYPCTQKVLQNAQGVIVHSAYSQSLARRWYGDQAGENWACIPLPRAPAFTAPDIRVSARTKLKLDSNKFVVCSFGLLGPNKCNHRLLDAWINSPLAADENCELIFVGGPGDDIYSRRLLNFIETNPSAARVRVTGWVDDDTYQSYLAAADIGVQLRVDSRGETSAAILDCLNYGLPTVINANGSMAELPDSITCKLPEEFTDEQLRASLVELSINSERRSVLSKAAQQYVHARHAPQECASQYANAIELFTGAATTSLPSLVEAIAQIDRARADEPSMMALAEAIDRSISLPYRRKQLLLDVSELVERDSKSGIQRVVRNIIQTLLASPPDGYYVEPVYANANQPGYQYARQFTLDLLACPSDTFIDDPITFSAGDIFLGLDLQLTTIPTKIDFYEMMQRHGVAVKFLAYDLLPWTHPHHFPPGSSTLFEAWLNTITQFDGVLCISKSTAEELTVWLANKTSTDNPSCPINWFHLGANFSSASHHRAPAESTEDAPDDRAPPRFLMVGTVEPRKGHAQTLFAFELLWKRGFDVVLVIAGKQGWMVDDLAKTLRTHPELNRRLFWLEGISDERLEKSYAASACLIAASECEGFGLPLIEAAQHKLPIIARDIPVFREVAGEHAYYFRGAAPRDLSESIVSWLQLYEAGQHPESDNLPWLTWEQSAQQLLAQVLPESRPTNAST